MHLSQKSAIKTSELKVVQYHRLLTLSFCPEGFKSIEGLHAADVREYFDINPTQHALELVWYYIYTSKINVVSIRFISLPWIVCINNLSHYLMESVSIEYNKESYFKKVAGKICLVSFSRKWEISSRFLFRWLFLLTLYPTMTVKKDFHDHSSVIMIGDCKCFSIFGLNCNVSRPLHKKWNLPLGISLVNVNKFTENCVFTKQYLLKKSLLLKIIY